MKASKLGKALPHFTKGRLGAGACCLFLVQYLPGGSLSAAPAAPNTTDIAVRQADALKQQQAQKPAADTEDQPPETYPGENEDLGPQMLLKAKKKKPLFEFSSDTMFTWTSNALASATNPREAGIAAETFSLTFAPAPLDLGPGKLSVRTGYRHLFWMYDVAKVGHKASPGDTEYGTLNGLNFEMSTLFAGAYYNFAENWNASLGVDYNRILNDQGLFDPSEWSVGRMGDYSKWSEVYVEWNPNWGLSRNIALGDKLNLTLSYSGGYHFTATDPNPKTNSGDKLDNNLSVSLTYAATDTITLQPNVRFSHSLYTQPQTTENLRRDRGITPGLTVLWMPSARISVRGSVSADFRHSNDQTLSPNSSKFDVGTGVTFTLKF